MSSERLDFCQDKGTDGQWYFDEIREIFKKLYSCIKNSRESCWSENDILQWKRLLWKRYFARRKREGGSVQMSSISFRTRHPAVHFCSCVQSRVISLTGVVLVLARNWNFSDSFYYFSMPCNRWSIRTCLRLKCIMSLWISSPNSSCPPVVGPKLGMEMNKNLHKSCAPKRSSSLLLDISCLNLVAEKEQRIGCFIQVKEMNCPSNRNYCLPAQCRLAPDL